MTDNRNYVYKGCIEKKRADEYKIIKKFIKRKSTVVDLGSGDGSLLLDLKNDKGIKGVGVEISKSGVELSERKGIKTINGRIDVKLPFKNNEFDYAICNVTIQMVMYPEILLREMVRISKKQIITLPNFAFLPNRLDLFLNGVMPRVMIPGYEWYSTGHIHQLSIKDFKDFCKKEGLEIIKSVYVGPPYIWIFPNQLLNVFPNIFAGLGCFVTKDKNNH